MFDRQILPRLRQRFGSKESLFTRVLRFTEIGEAALAEALVDLIEAQSDPTLALYAGRGEVRLRLASRAKDANEAEACFAPIDAAVQRRVGSHLYGRDHETLEAVVGEMLKTTETTLAIAESCTGGLLGHRVTNVPGSSAYFRGGVLAYADDVKATTLGVPKADLQKHGAVSAVIAEAMAHGVRERLGATYGISITGIAGPDGGTEEKPVGTVFIAWAGPEGCLAKRFQFYTNRESFKGRTTTAAL